MIDVKMEKLKSDVEIFDNWKEKMGLRFVGAPILINQAT